MNKPPQKDTIYQAQQSVEPFAFNQRVVDVFDDMIERSVPGYGMLLQMISLLSQRFNQPNTHCYDFGCSLGASSYAMLQTLSKDCRLIAVDNSEAMITTCRERLTSLNSQHSIEYRCEDMAKTHIENNSFGVLNLTLQFLPLEQRDAFIQRIAENTVTGGALLLSEKITLANQKQNQLLIELHHSFKRQQGYSDLEIAQKRNALDNILISETYEAHRRRLLQSGFSDVMIWFQCFNFISILAIK